MAQGLGGLAQGFIQGSRLGMQFKGQEREAERQSELSELRQKSELRAQETHEQSKTLRQLQENRLGSQEKRAVSAEKRAVKTSERQDELFDWRVAKDERVENDKKLSSVAPIEYQRVAGGGDFSPEFMEEAKGTRFDPVYMATPEFREASKLTFNHVGDLVKKAQTDGASSIELGDVNNAEFIDSLNVLMAPDIKRGIGEKDPTTGKTIANKELAMIIPHKNKGLVFEVRVELDDGSSYMAPITEGRSTDPDDPVKVVPIGKFMDTVEGYTRMASAYNQPDLQNAVARYAGTPAKPNSSLEATNRQYLKVLTDIDRDETKELMALESALGAIATPEAKNLITTKYQELRDKTSTRYGRNAPQTVGKGTAAVQKPRGGGQTITDVEKWSEGDSNKVEFIKTGEPYSSASSGNPFNAFSPIELEKTYAAWRNDKEADEVAGILRQ